MAIRFDVKKGIIWIQAKEKTDAAKALQALRLLVDECDYTNGFILEESDTGTGFSIACCSDDTIKAMRNNINYIKELMRAEDPTATDIAAAIDDWNYINQDDLMVAVKEETKAEQQTIETIEETNMSEQQATEIKEVTVIFNDDSSDSLPVYTMYCGQCSPQAAYITLDLRDGEVDADYNGETSNAVPFSVWNDVVIRFPIDPCLTGEGICNLIEMVKDDLQAFYNKSDTEINFNGDEIGIPADENIDRADWQEKIRNLQDTIEYNSHNLAVYIADDDTFNEAIKLTPDTGGLSDYAASVLDSIKENCFVEGALDDIEVVSRLIMEMYVHNTECLNKNGMNMLLANIDDYSDQIGYDRDDIDEDDIEAAMKRA